MGSLYLVRHGQASFGAADYDQLSELGVIQSDLLGRWLSTAGLRPTQVISGTMKRHRQTADACLAAWFGGNGSPVLPIVDSAFNEFDHEEVLIRARPEFAEAGRLEQFIAAQPEGQRAFQAVFAASVGRWIDSNHDADYGETWGQFRTRCVDGLLAVAGRQADGDSWIFTSGGPIAAIFQHVLAIPNDRILDLNWSILNTGVTQFVHRNGRTRLQQFNSVAHLALAGRPGLESYR